MRPNDVYAARLIYQTIGGQKTLVMYFGGWYATDPHTLPNDAIYRAVCPTPDKCGDIREVIDPVATGMGAAALVNDPAIVEMDNFGRPYLIMYMSGVLGEDRDNCWTTQNNQIYWSMSWADDGINWSKPKLLIDNAWMPTVTKDAFGNVILYANTNWNNNPYFMSRYNLGPSGIEVSPPEPMLTDNNVKYINMEIRFNDALQLFEMVGQQTTDEFNSQIDYLTSYDGTNWSVGSEHIIPDSITPAVHPDSACFIYYGRMQGTNHSNIHLRRWC